MSLGEIQAAIEHALRDADQARTALAKARQAVETAAAEVTIAVQGTQHRKPGDALRGWREADSEAEKAAVMLADGAQHARTYLDSLA